MFLFHILLFHLHRDDGGDDRDDAHAPLHVPHLRRYHDDVLHDLLLHYLLYLALLSNQLTLMLLQN